jgi:hypothetical protein
MVGIIIANMVAMLLLFVLLTAIVLIYFKEVKLFREKEAEMDKQIKYYIKELEKRSKDKDVDLY